MLSDKQLNVVLDAYDSKYGTKGPRDKYGFPVASYRWHGFLAACELLMPVIVAANKKYQWLACNSLVRPGTILIEYTKLCKDVDDVTREAGL